MFRNNIQRKDDDVEDDGGHGNVAKQNIIPIILTKTKELCKLLNFDGNVSIKIYKMYKKCLSMKKTNIENNVIIQ